VGDDPTLQLAGVIRPRSKRSSEPDLTIDDIDWIEINEAFASVVLAWSRN
jgi:acetyl-CoA acetyltransferase